MSLSDDIKLYLPPYLSAEDNSRLISNIVGFPDNVGKNFFTSSLKTQKTIFQGDGVSDLLINHLPDKTIKVANCIIISNTCDIDPSNKRLFPSRICYAPIFNLVKYLDGLKEVGLPPRRIEQHERDIKQQIITQILYLPKCAHLFEDSIVFLDRICNCSSDYIDRKNIEKLRLFTLSQFGHYVFLVKMSIHFTRIQERVNRS